MRALLCERLGGPDDLVLAEVPEPEPQAGEVIVGVSAAALNFFDTLIIAGRYQFKPALPFSPGGECCGRILALGAGVEGWQVGERVAAYTGWGAARERVAVPALRLARVPDAVTDEQAAGLTITYGTALHALKDRARVRAGETLAVLGAAGGTGLAAVEIGRALGATVIACASSPEKLAVAQEHGASLLLDYAAQDLRGGLKELTGGAGVDVVLDPVGGELAEPALRAIAWAGRYLVVGFAGGEIPKIALNLALLKGCDIQGVFWGAFAERDPQANAANQEWLFARTAEGALSARVHAEYPLEQGAEALQVIARREATGKVLLRP
ncbi:MAG TPA: NADPH:quinone oxidoreductase family protein [Beijerinckiaceae bacterium]|jgi:NADPH2:quinone reductase